MADVETTLGDLRNLSTEELEKMALESDHPDFVKRMLEEVKAHPAQLGDEVAFIQWGWSRMA